MSTRATAAMLPWTLAPLLLVWSSGAPPARADEPEQRTLNVVNWSWYIEVDDEADEELPLVLRSPVLRQFMREQNCDLSYVELDDEGAMRDYILANPGGVDVINFSTGIVADLASRGVLARIDEELVPHRKDVRADLRAAILEETWKYSTPYFVGYTGILYRKDLVSGAVRSWRQFLEPAEGQRIGLLNAPDSVFGIASLTLGHPMNTVEPAQIRAAAELVLGLRKSGRIEYLGDDLDHIAGRLRAGDLTMALMYSGDGLGYVEEDPSGTLVFGIPAEGTDFYIDNWAISARTKNRELAHAFIDFSLRPEIQVRQALYLLVQTVTNEGLDALRKQHADHPYLRYLASDPDMRARTHHIHRKNGQELSALWDRIMDL